MSDEADGTAATDIHTHCSAFAAAIGERLGIYMLRPPDHPQTLLASAQTHWFATPAGAAAGWKPVADARTAQTLANQGNLVVVAYESPNPHKPGHIAIVRPSEKSMEALLQEGPEITQAGTTNHTDWTVAEGFRGHRGAWPDGVRYFVHDPAGAS